MKYIPIAILSVLFFSCVSYAAPVAVKTDRDILILENPAKRIVVLEFSLLDDLLQLGVKPIGLASSQVDEGTNPPFLMPTINKITDVGTRQQPNLEKIMSLHPDLIVADTTFQGKIYPLLAKIAPTLLLNGLLGDYKTQIENLKILADATGSKNKVEGLSKRLLDKYESAKKIGIKHPATVIIGYANNVGQFQALTANALTSKILKDFAHPNMITISREEQSTPIPLEAILAQNPDNIIILLTNGNRAPYEILTKKPLWKQIRAVKNRRVYFMDRDIWAKNHGVLATHLLLNEAIETGFLTNRPNISL